MRDIRSLFSNRRPIDRTIEKVIDYAAQQEERLAAEIEEYEVTDKVEACFRRFLDLFDEGVRGGRVTEVGIWISGFYGSGKSSFTKYLGFALDPERKVQGRPFLDLLCDRFQRPEIPAQLRTVARREPTAVVMLDLGTEQLAESTAVPVSTVLYWKVLEWAGYAKEKKLARLELTLESQGKLDELRRLYRDRFNGEWETIHNDPLLGPARAAQIVPQLLPQDFPDAQSFRAMRFEETRDVADLASEMIALARRKTGRQNILFLVDEAGQYVAPRGDLILNLDGLARALKEAGQGRAWIVATGQQTLTEIVERALHNSDELNKLQARFPIAIHLDASDIREITYRRLLSKNSDAERALADLWSTHGPSLVAHTRLSGTSLYRGDPDGPAFARLYPFLPQHFDLLLEMIRTLARSTGGVGLRSAIRVIQDVLVDKSRVLPPDAVKLADRLVGTLACVDDFYTTLRADLTRVLPHVVAGVDRVLQVFAHDPVAQRVARAVAALQPIETFPRTAENIAALLHPAVDSPSLTEEVRRALRAIVDSKECGLIEDPQAGGYVFLSEAIRPLREKRSAYVPTSAEAARVKADVLRQGVPECPLFSVQPSARLDQVKEVRAAVKLGRVSIIGSNEEIDLVLEWVDPVGWDRRRGELLVETNTKTELKNAIVWLARSESAVDDHLQEIVRSEKILGDADDRGADHDVAQFMRAERRLAERNREAVAKALQRSLMEGTMIFRGKPTPASEASDTLETAAREVLGRAAKEVFPYHHLAAQRVSTEAAAKFLAVEQLGRMTRDLDPLGFVVRKGSQPRVDLDHPALAEALRKFDERVAESGSGRLQGNAVQDLFSSAPYGWSKDTVRYVFASLLTAGEIELHTPSGTVKTPGPVAVEAMKSTVAFNKIGVSHRDVKVPVEALDRASQRLESLFGDEVLPLEDHISRSVRKRVPEVMEKVGPLPDRLRLLGLPGEARARELLANAAALLSGDAGDAASILGASSCSIPDDLLWARHAVDALDNGAEEQVRGARGVLDGLRDLDALIPGSTEGLVSDLDQETIQEMLASERFYEKISDLRSAVRRVLDGVVCRYEKGLEEYEAALQAGLGALEKEPSWPRLDSSDQEEIAGRLQASLPQQPARDHLLRSLQALLVRRSALPGLLETLRREIEVRVPDERDRELEKEPEAEAVLGLADLEPPAILHTLDELRVWLDALENRLGVILREGRQIRFRP
jgi:hypothetical protein